MEPGNYSVRDLNAVIVAKISSEYNMGDIFVASYDVKTNSRHSV